MTTPNHNRNIFLAILVVILLLFALRSIFFVLPFGLFHGVSNAFRDADRAFWGASGWSIFRIFPLFLLPVAFLALWVFVLIWVYRDAEQRGMSGILWMLLVLIGNVIGLLIFLIMRHEMPLKRAEGSGQAGAVPGGTAGAGGAQAGSATGGAAGAECCCPGCGKPMATDHAYCPGCGRPTKAVCPSCKKPVQEGWKVCPYCGTSLDPNRPVQA